MAVLQYVERELLNHNRLLHPHIVQFREVSMQGCQASTTALLGCIAGPHSSWTCPRDCVYMFKDKQQWLCK